MPGRILVDFTPLRESRDFRWLFSGTLISTLGAQLTVVAIPYQVYELTHSSFQVGAVSLVQLIPIVIGSLVGGSIGDAVDRRTLMIVSTSLLALTSGALAVNSLVASPSLLAIYLVSAVAGALGGFVSTARLASIPVLVKPLHLSAAYAFSQIVFQVGTVVGPALSGLLLRPVGLSGVYSIDAGTYIIGALTCFVISSIPPTPGAARPGIGSFVEGVRYLKGRPVIQGVFLVASACQGRCSRPWRNTAITAPWLPPRCSGSFMQRRGQEHCSERSSRAGSRISAGRDGRSLWP
jgi:MFS family permease